MKSRRDTLIALGVVGAVALIAALVFFAVLDARDRGRSALERNQETTIRQLAASMDQRIASTYEAFEGIADPLSFAPGSPTDQAQLKVLQDLNPDATSGFVLVGPDGVVTNGTLLADPASVGTPLDRPGLDRVLDGGTPAILPAAPGITTSLPTIAIAMPALDETGAVRGAFLSESVISADSDFNKEIAQLRQGETGVFTFVDELGTVIVATDPDLLGEPLADPDVLSGRPGLERVDGEIVGIADVPSAGWRLLFNQSADEFESGLGERVQLAVLLLIAAGLAGGALAFVVVLRRMRAERAERARVEELNATREEFISIVSHELRTPVAGVLGFLESAVDHWATMSEQEQRHALDRAYANARRLQVLTRDVLDTTAIESGEMSYVFDIVEIGDEVDTAVIAARDADPNHAYRLETSGGPAWVRADPDRIQQVMFNLLDNAAKNSPPDSDIAVSLEVLETEAVVSVRDRGPGLTAEEREHAFEKWVRGRSTVQGTGLGLFVADQIVAAHHGRLEADNAPDGGAVFRFAIPLTATPAESVRA